MKTRISILAAVIICLIALHYYCGLFTPYNYLTAKWDLLNDNPTIVIYGSPEQTDKEKYIVAPQFGFKIKRIAACTVSKPLVNGVQQHNAVTIRHLDDKLGPAWKRQFEAEVDALFRLHRGGNSVSR